MEKFTIRQKIVFGTLVSTFLFFIFVTPIISWGNDFLKKPDDLKNIEVTVNLNNSVVMSWDKSFDIDLKQTVVYANGQRFELDENLLEYGIENLEFPLSLRIEVEDWFGNTRETLDVNFNEPSQDRVITRVFNQLEQDSDIALNIFVRSFAVGLAVFVITMIIFRDFLNITKSRYLGLFAPLCVIPLVIFTSTIVESENSLISQLLIGAGFSILFATICYFLLLTTNILNTSLIKDLPLSQAARASQFIFSLISVYLVLILFFSSSYDFIIKAIFIVIFTFVLTFLTLLMLPNSSTKSSAIKSLGISIAVFFASFVFGIWPVDYIYAILGIAVVYYILLSISLEFRGKITKYVWWEYVFIIILITALLVMNSYWGINGSLI